jgi:flavorubredoxin
MAAFTTGNGGQGMALDDIEKILKSITTELVRNSIAIEGTPNQIDKTHANNLGETLAKQVIRKFVDL